MVFAMITNFVMMAIIARAMVAPNIAHSRPALIAKKIIAKNRYVPPFVAMVLKPRPRIVIPALITAKTAAVLIAT